MAPARLLLLLALVALSGCVSLPGAPDAVLPGDPVPVLHTLYLTGAPGLSPLAPSGEEPERVASGGFFTQWGGGEGGFVQFVGAPLEETLLVTGAIVLTGYAEAEGAAAQAGVFPHFIGYFGTDRALNADGAGDGGSPVMGPGDVAEFAFPIEPPRGGLVLEKGSRPRVLVATVMTQESGNDVQLLVNATAAPARVAFEAVPVPDVPPVAAPEGNVVTGRLVGSAYAPSQEGASRQSHPFQVGPDVARVDVHLDVDQAAGFADLDVVVVGPSGEELARGVTPLGAERMRLHPVNLEGVGTYQAVVVNYGSATASYNLDIRVAHV